MKLISRRDTAARLLVSERTLSRLVAEKRIRPVYPSPGKQAFYESEVDAYLASLRKKVA